MTLPHPWHCECAACKPVLAQVPTEETPKWIIDGCIIIGAPDYFSAREFAYRLLGTGLYPKSVEPCRRPDAPKARD